jgi:DNA polymerase/3'-5' exonuclease PolX
MLMTYKVSVIIATYNRYSHLIDAINSIKKYEGIIESGSQLRNELKGVGEKISKRVDEILETGTLSELNGIDFDNNTKRRHYR